MKRLSILMMALVMSSCSVYIPAIDLSEFIVFGEQKEIDDGHVVLPTWGGISDGHGGRYIDSCLPKQGCPVWLAGHRTSHGSVFNRIPELEVGDLVFVRVLERYTVYKVTHSKIVPRLFPASEMVGDLIIQTSWPNDQRYLVFGKELGR